jgi:serine/threonine protein kinase
LIRDVKPSNILINSAGAVRLSDFAVSAAQAMITVHTTTAMMIPPNQVSATVMSSFDKTKSQVNAATGSSWSSPILRQ